MARAARRVLIAGILAALAAAAQDGGRASMGATLSAPAVPRLAQLPMAIMALSATSSSRAGPEISSDRCARSGAQITVIQRAA